MHISKRMLRVFRKHSRDAAKNKIQYQNKSLSRQEFALVTFALIDFLWTISHDTANSNLPS